MLLKASELDEFFGTTQATENGYEIGTWNVRSELAKYDLDLVAVQEVRWVEGGNQSADDYTYFYVNVSANCHLGTGLFIHK
jgi:hypothetical protein